jgi:hypothetical protein
MSGRENRSTRRKPTPAQLCLPQIPYDLFRDRNRTASATARPFIRPCLSSRVAVSKSVYRQAADWTPERSEFESRQDQAFSLLHIVQTDSGIHQASYPMGRRRGCYLRGIKRPVCEADQLLRTSVAVKKKLIYTYIFVGWWCHVTASYSTQ